MDALLILAGLLLFVVGLIWLVLRAFTTHFGWGLVSLLPPLTLVFVFRHWAVAARAVLVVGLGAISFLVGLAMLAHRDAQRFDDLIGLTWLYGQGDARPVSIQLNGELYGATFRPLEGELVNGVLSLREGQDFFARRELNISLPERFAERLQIDVLPDEVQDLPEIEISWLQPDQDLPEARRLTRGYTLHLHLQPKAPNLLEGDLHLSLPPRFKTRLSGTVQVYRDGLRYRDGVVDRQVDSHDTLAFVIRDYLQRRFVSRDVKIEYLPQVAFPANDLEVLVEASVEGEAQTLPVQLKKEATRGWAVVNDRFPALPATGATPVVTPATEVREVEPKRSTISRPVDRRLRFSMQRLLGNPAHYRNLTMRVYLLRGGKAEGRFQGLSPEGLIEIRRNMKGAGGVSFSFNPSEIEAIELLEP